MSKIDKNGKITIDTPDGGSYVIQEGREPKPKRTKSSHANIFVIFLLILIIISLCSYFKTGQASSISFKSLIEYLSSAPNIDISWNLIDLTIYVDWGMFNFLRDILNWFTNIFEVLVSLFNMLIQVLKFIFYLVKGLLFY